MKGNQLRNELNGLGTTQVGFARYIGVDERTVRAWIADLYSVPRYVEVIIDQLKHGGSPIEDSAKRLNGKRGRR